jgi:hypothetical protein
MTPDAFHSLLVENQPVGAQRVKCVVQRAGGGSVDLDINDAQQQADRLRLGPIELRHSGDYGNTYVAYHPDPRWLAHLKDKIPEHEVDGYCWELELQTLIQTTSHATQWI